jgi:cation diffusion facilitator CzcD-associated flavoprotein CzcO
MKRLIAKGVIHAIGEEQNRQNFTPRYNPWDQRLCLIPDADLFEAIKKGTAAVVTDEIDAFDENGIRLRSGRLLDADIVVTATGLTLRIMSGMQLVVDGEPVDMSKKFVYKGMMFNDVPNLVFAIGYTNASWTLKCDLTAQYACRLLSYMDKHGYASCTPKVTEDIEPIPVIDFNSTYVLKAIDELPKQGSKTPWRLHQNYVRDLLLLRHATLDDGTMEFVRTGGGSSRAAPRI